MSVAIENFVKAVYQHKRLNSSDTKPGTIAKKLGITNAAATDMAKKLAVKNLIDYEKYKALKLTDSGNAMALKVIRKHRIWESFLFKHLNLSLHEIHREAELLEHQTSDFLAEKIHEYLGFPQFDPHGDPIPDVNGTISNVANLIPLSNAAENKEYKVLRLQSDDKDFFDFCTLNGLTNQAVIEVEKQFSTTNMTQITINNKTLLLNRDFTTIIYVQEK